MDVRILDLDGSVAQQPSLARLASRILPLRGWGPRLRLACGWDGFRAFQDHLAGLLRTPCDPEAELTFVGSGDFHHVSLALLARQSRPCNLLVLDNHPDWVRGVPFLHCGTWLAHVARFERVARIFHVGGEVDFDNFYRWAAPWQELFSGKIVVLPAIRRFQGRDWNRLPHTPLREQPRYPVSAERIADLLDPWRDELGRLPLYVSLDRDVLGAEHAVVNWDSGQLIPAEVLTVIEAFSGASGGLAGMDVVGDWSRVRVQGITRHLLHWGEHPRLAIDPVEAQHRNEAFNLTLVERFASLAAHDCR